MLSQDIVSGLEAERQRLGRLPELPKAKKTAINSVLKSFKGTGSALYAAALDEADKFQTPETKKKVAAIDSLLGLYGHREAKRAAPAQKGRGTSLRVVITALLRESEAPMTRSAICDELKEKGVYYTDSNVISILSSGEEFIREGDRNNAMWRLVEQPSE